MIRASQEPAFSPRVINYLLRPGPIYPTKLRAQLGCSPAVDQEAAFARTESWLRGEGYLIGS